MGTLFVPSEREQVSGILGQRQIKNPVSVDRYLVLLLYRTLKDFNDLRKVLVQFSTSGDALTFPNRRSRNWYA